MGAPEDFYCVVSDCQRAAEDDHWLCKECGDLYGKVRVGDGWWPSPWVVRQPPAPTKH